MPSTPPGGVPEPETASESEAEGGSSAGEGEAGRARQVLTGSQPVPLTVLHYERHGL
jgi:hypothetical protein